MTLKEQAYSAMLGRILSGALTPGELLNRRGMAQELCMSAAPVHEAMIQLERDGFLEALPRLGTRVRTVSREDVRGHLVLREAFECQAARMICGIPVQRCLPRLQTLAQAADTPDDSDTGRAKAEVAFHVALVELAACPALLHEYHRVMQIGLFYRINLLMTMPSRGPENRHALLLDDLCNLSSPSVEDCVRRHIWSGKPDTLHAFRRLEQP